MYPRVVNGKTYCCKTVRVDSLFGSRITTKSYGHCKGYNPKNVKCQNYNCKTKKPQIKAEIELEPIEIKPIRHFIKRF